MNKPRNLFCYISSKGKPKTLHIAISSPGQGCDKMLSQEPIDLGKVKQTEVDKEALRLAIIAELDAVSLYEQLAAIVKKEDLKKVLLEVAREEKTHVGEFQALLLKYDEEQAEELEKGAKEVEELTEK
jgi:rubrerythrin